MTEQEVFRRIYDADAAQIERLTAEIAHECRDPAKTVLDAWRQGAPCGEACCAFVCRHLEELAIGEMLDAAAAAAPAMRVQLMEMVVDRHLVLREYLLTVVQPLLESDAPGSPMRVCDAAYLIARRLVPITAEEALQFSDPGTFLVMPKTKRDTEIGAWKSSKTWTGLFAEPRTTGS
jgi:hypothetical protein